MAALSSVVVEGSITVVVDVIGVDVTIGIEEVSVVATTGSTVVATMTTDEGADMVVSFIYISDVSNILRVSVLKLFLGMTSLIYD